MITPDRARELLDGATPGPWYLRETDALMNGRAFTIREVGRPGIRVSATTYGHNGDPELIAAAPAMASTIAGMEWEWGVQHGTTVICLDFYGTEDEEVGRPRWTASRSRAEEWKRKMEGYFPGETYRLVHRPVGSAEVVDGE